ncbi:cell division protein ZapE [Micrococcales bacterium KH10]|nr:cell division protein ZapE [Micrococcales bacterium KH10]
MSNVTSVPTVRLADRQPQVSTERLLADLVPPPHFSDATFNSYIANPAHPSQSQALERLQEVAAQVNRPRRRGVGALLRKQSTPPAVYLDGGFGVGKTHLLAALSHAVAPGTCVFGTFVEYTNLVGSLGFSQAVSALSHYRLVCIDEFELDDPGDTVLMSRLLRELADNGVALVATSNTLPEALGEGRFAAEDFLREIQALAARFEVIRIDGEDYRHRSVRTQGLVLPEAQFPAEIWKQIGLDAGEVTFDDFAVLRKHLERVHPSQYGAMLDGVRFAVLTGVGALEHQHDALRFVVLVDRLYDRDIPTLLLGDAQAQVFTDVMLQGGYRKKYYRTLSRLGSLTGDASELLQVADK